MKIIDLFSGAGGLSKGFEMAGYQVILGIDNYEYALETFYKNHRNSSSLKLDLHKPPPKKLINELKDEIDGVIGGPPCQGFSDAKGSRNTKDPRNNLVPQFINWINNIHPTFFVMENVTGIKTIEKGQFFKKTIEKLRRLGYVVQYKVLHAASYGVPQKRERMFVIGIDQTILEFVDTFFPKETHYVPTDMRGQYPKAKTMQTSLEEFYDQNTQKKPYNTVAHAFEGLPLETPETGIVHFDNPPNNELMGFIRDNGRIVKTDLHIAQKIPQKDLYIASKIPEGKIFRSNRFGERYVPIWKIVNFTKEERETLHFIASHQTKKNFLMDPSKEENFVKEEAIPLSDASVLDKLVSEGWLKTMEKDGQKGYKITTKAGLRPRFTRLDRNNISHTILTVDFNGREKLHPVANRGISLREGARLQTFPDDFSFSGKFNDIAIQIGNAVPPLLAYKIAIHLKNMFKIKSVSMVEIK